MIDTKKPLRTAYYQLLSGALSDGLGNVVPVGDETTPYPDTLNCYVILSSQHETYLPVASVFDSWHEIVIDIVYKAASRTGKAAVDNIANQIVSLILPQPDIHGLPPQTGIQITNVQKVNDIDLPMLLNNSNTVVRRVLTFKQYIRQTQNNTPVVGISGILPVLSAAFANSTDYINQNLFGKTYQIFYNDANKFLTQGTDWDYLSNLGQPGNGGFRILINNFNAQTQSHVFYVLLS